MRQLRVMGDLRIDDELILELGAAYRVDPVVGLELGGPRPPEHRRRSTRATRPTARSSARDVPVGSALLIEAIVGAGIQQGFGTPDWRGVLAVRYGR